MKNFIKLIDEPKPVLVDFFAEWCGPCRMMSPILEKVKRELGDSASIIKIDVDKNPTIAQEFGIRGVPTFILFKFGVQQWRHSGLLHKEDLVNIINKYK